MLSHLAERYCSSNMREKDKQEDKSKFDFQVTYIHLYFVWPEFPLRFFRRCLLVLSSPD